MSYYPFTLDLSRRFLLFLLMLLASRPVFGLEEDSIIEMYGDPKLITLATGYQQPLFDAPAAATVVTASEIHAMGAISLDQVIETVTGFHISATSGAVTVGTVRGITSRVLVLINGIPIANGLVNAFQSLSNILLYDIQRLEVIRGPGSAVYGADAFAGVINIVTKTPKDIDGTKVGGLAGSHDTFDGWFLHGGHWGGAEIALYLADRTTNGSNETVKADAQTSFDRLFGTSASLAPSSINNDTDVTDARIDVSKGPWRLRMNYFKEDKLGTGVGFANALDRSGMSRNRLFNTDLTYHRSFSETVDIQAYIAYVQLKFEAKGVKLFPDGAFGGAFPEGVRQDLALLEDKFRADVTTLYSGFDNHILRIGVGTFLDSLDTRKDRRNYTVARGLIVPTGFFDENGGVGDQPFFPDKNRDVFFGYVQDEWAIAPDWTVTAGLRADHYSDFGATLNPRVGIVWNISPTLNTKLLYGRAFRPPSIIEQGSNGLINGLGNESLDPVTIDMVELALSYRSRRFRTGLTVFGYDIDDLIQLVPNPQSPNGLGFTNKGGQKGYGIEWDFLWDVNEIFGIKGNYSFQARGNDIDDNANSRFAPKHQIYFATNWQALPNWNFNINLTSIIDRERPNIDSRSDIDDYTLVTLAIQRKNISRHLDVSLSVRNLFDDNAREPSGSARVLPFDIPLPGRTFYGQLILSF